MEKCCPSCRITKPRREFHKRRASKDGVQHFCKLCQIALVAARRATPEGQAYHRQYYLDHKLLTAIEQGARVERRRAYLHAYCRSHAAAFRRYTRNYYWRNVVQERARKLTYYHQQKAKS
jgi:hypothetical protein